MEGAKEEEEVAQVAGGGRQENEEKVIMEEKNMRGGETVGWRDERSKEVMMWGGGQGDGGVMNHCR